jgi:hypothetical protein
MASIQNIEAGTKFIDFSGRTLHATTAPEFIGVGWYVRVGGQGYPEFYTEDSVFTIIPAKDPSPFKVYYRTGTGRKGMRSFATRAAQTRWITKAPFDYAITAWS